MSSKKELVVIALLAIVYTILFHNNPLGINLLIFELLVLIALLAFKKISIKSSAILLSVTGLFITGFASVFIYFFWAKRGDNIIFSIRGKIWETNFQTNHD